MTNFFTPHLIGSFHIQPYFAFPCRLSCQALNNIPAETHIQEHGPESCLRCFDLTPKFVASIKQDNPKVASQLPEPSPLIMFCHSPLSASFRQYNQINIRNPCNCNHTPCLKELRVPIPPWITLAKSYSIILSDVPGVKHNMQEKSLKRKKNCPSIGVAARPINSCVAGLKHVYTVT